MSKKIGKWVPAIQLRLSDCPSALFIGLRYSKTHSLKEPIEGVYRSNRWLGSIQWPSLAQKVGEAE